VHSATKYISGHSDVLMGALVTRDDELFDVLKGRRDLIGAIPGPMEAWLALRGLRTLHLRVERAQANAQELVTRLRAHAASLERSATPASARSSAIELAQGALAADLLCTRRSSGCTPPRSAASSRPSSAGVAGRPSRRREDDPVEDL
jgi:cystathionine gamma-synthase